MKRLLPHIILLALIILIAVAPLAAARSGSVVQIQPGESLTVTCPNGYIEVANILPNASIARLRCQTP